MYNLLNIGKTIWPCQIGNLHNFVPTSNVPYHMHFFRQIFTTKFVGLRRKRKKLQLCAIAQDPEPRHCFPVITNMSSQSSRELPNWTIQLIQELDGVGPVDNRPSTD